MHLAAITVEHANLQIDTIVANSGPEGATADAKKRAAALGNWIALWASKRRRFVSVAVCGPDGQPASSNEMSAHFLACHWQPVF